MISSEANDIAEKEAKKTIACEHVTKALEDLGFQDYVQGVLEIAVEHKEQQKVGVCKIEDAIGDANLSEYQSREKRQSKLEQSGLSEAELLRQQEELFAGARTKFQTVPEGE